MLDIGTGTGCLGITAILENLVDKVDAIDISDKALKIAKKNKKILSADNIYFSNIDILNNVPSNQYDIIISNPPYISWDEYSNIDIEVKNYEPREALTDLDTGYTFYVRYASILNELLNDSGIAVFEISHYFCQSKLKNIFKAFSDVTFYKDLNGDNRAIRIKR